VLQRDESSPDAVWLVQLETPGVGGNIRQAIARFYEVDHNLRFEWDETAKRLTAAKLLQNCLLRVSSDANSRLIALRRWVLLADGDSRGKLASVMPDQPLESRPQEFEIIDLPENADLRVELLGIEPIDAFHYDVSRMGGPELTIIPASKFRFEPKEISVVARAQISKDQKKLNIYFDFGLIADKWTDLLIGPFLSSGEPNRFFSPISKAFNKKEISRPTTQGWNEIIEALQKKAKSAANDLKKAETDRDAAQSKPEDRAKHDTKVDNMQKSKSDADQREKEAALLRDIASTLRKGKSKIRFRVVLYIEKKYRVVLIATDEKAVSEDLPPPTVVTASPSEK
jgi:hypothetical protein